MTAQVSKRRPTPSPPRRFLHGGSSILTILVPRERRRDEDAGNGCDLEGAHRESDNGLHRASSGPGVTRREREHATRRISGPHVVIYRFSSVRRGRRQDAESVSRPSWRGLEAAQPGILHLIKLNSGEPGKSEASVVLKKKFSDGFTRACRRRDGVVRLNRLST